MKKLVTLLLFLAIGLTFVGCSVDQSVAIETDQELFTLQALSSTSLLNYNDLSVQETAFVPLAEVTTEETTEVTTEVDGEDPIITEEVKDIDYYVEMMDMFLGDESLTVTVEESDNELYEFKTVYTTLNLSGDTITYTFYYNEYRLADEELETPAVTTELLPENAKRNFHFMDEDDNLVAYSIDGILIYGDITYNIEGKKIVNSQQEIYRLRSFIDEENYVIVNYQNDTTDRNREKFFFKLVEDGITVNEAKVMMFTKFDRLHLKLGFLEGDKESSYLFNVRTEGDTQYIHIIYEIKDGESYEEGSIRLVAETDPVTGETVYTYSMTPDRAKERYENTFRHKNQHMNQFGGSRQ